MTRALLLLLVLAGCRQVFGIDDIDPSSPMDAPGDADVDAVVATGPLTLHVTLTEVKNDDTGRPTILAYAPEDAGVTVHVNGERVVFDVMDAEVTVPDGLAHVLVSSELGDVEYQTRQRDVTLTVPRLSRLGPPGLSGTASAPSNQSKTRVLVTTGVFSQSLSGIGSSFDLASQSPYFGPLTQLSAAEHDLLYLLQYDLVEAGGGQTYVALKAASSTPPGSIGSVTLLNAETALPQQCARIDARHAQETSRLRDLGYTVADTADWNIVAEPAPSFQRSIGPVLAQGAAGQMNRDIAGAYFYGNPFDGYETDATMSTIAKFHFDSRNPFEVTGGTQIWVPLPASGSCDAPTLLAANQVAAIRSIALGGMDITHGATLAAPTGDLELTWETDTGPVDRFVAIVLEVGDESFVPHSAAYIVEGRRAVVPGTLFASGHRYVVQLIAAAGWPGIADGDFTRIGTAFGRSISYSGIVAVP